MLSNMRLTTPNRATLDDVASRYVSTGEAADELGVSRNTLERWARQGKVKPALITAGGHYRWDVEDLKRQLADRGGERSG
jgi:excisionase family DNA binding protein